MSVTGTGGGNKDLRLTSEPRPEHGPIDSRKRRVERNNSMNPGWREKAPEEASPGRTRARRRNIQAIRPILLLRAGAFPAAIAFSSPAAAFVVTDIRFVAAGFGPVSIGVVTPRISDEENPDIVMSSLDPVGISSSFVASGHGAAVLGCVAAAYVLGPCGLVCVGPSFALNHHAMLYHAISQA